jgi:hypothetical protein
MRSHAIALPARGGGEDRNSAALIFFEIALEEISFRPVPWIAVVESAVRTHTSMTISMRRLYPTRSTITS